MCVYIYIYAGRLGHAAARQARLAGHHGSPCSTAAASAKTPSYILIPMNKYGETTTEMERGEESGYYWCELSVCVYVCLCL
jgi:hypothetical protein